MKKQCKGTIGKNMSRAKTTKSISKHAAGIKLPAVTIPDESSKGFPIPENKIEEIRSYSNQKLLFSYRFLDIEHEAFNLGNTELKWFLSLLKVQKEISKLTRNELIQQRNHYQCHGHDWGKLQYKYNFPDDFLEQVECLQFRLSQSSGRVHGFIIGNRFYIVWLDPHHNLYPDERHGGCRFYDKPLNCYEELLVNYNELKSQNDKLLSQMEELNQLLEDC